MKNIFSKNVCFITYVYTCNFDVKDFHLFITFFYTILKILKKKQEINCNKTKFVCLNNHWGNLHLIILLVKIVGSYSNQKEWKYHKA